MKNKTLESFNGPKLVYGSEIKVGYFYYCNFSKKNGPWLKVVYKRKEYGEGKTLFLFHDDTAPIVLEDDQLYKVKFSQPSDSDIIVFPHYLNQS
jgi:hypothetical protein